MQGLQAFLSRFKGLENKEEKVIEMVHTVLKNIYAISIEKTNITIQKNIVFLNTSSVIKNVVGIKKESILTSFKKNDPQSTLVDIR